MTEWKSYKLADVCSRLRSGKTISATSVSPNGKYAVIGGNGVRGYTEKSNFKGQCVVVGRQGAYCGNVRYFDGEPDAYTDFNEGYFDEDETVYALEKSDIGNVAFEQVEGDSVTLLSIPTSLLALFNFDCKFLSFVVSKEQVVEQKFDNCQVRFLK